MLASCFTMICLGLAAAALPAPFSATVKEVVSPQVLLVQGPQGDSAVRLYGIDAPEAMQPRHADALALVRELALGKQVEILPMATDDAGLLVAKVTLPGQAHLQTRLLEAGLAWWDNQNAPNDSEYRRLNANALLDGQGIFSDTLPLAPWDYRQSHGGEEIRYELSPAEDPAAESAETETVPTIKAKGSYTVTAPAITPEMIRQAEQLDPLALLFQHQPQLARDPSGKVLGLTANNISQIPLATALGFRNGDIISSVNGIQLQNEGQIMGLIQQLQGARQLEVQLIRGGTPTTVTIALP